MKEYKKADLDGLAFTVSNKERAKHGMKPISTVFYIVRVNDTGSIDVGFEGCTRLANYATHWALHYLNTGTWIVVKN